MRCFIAYWIDDWCEKSIPIAIGEDKSDVLACGIHVVLLMGILDGSVGVQEHNDLNAQEYEELRTMLEGFYIKWGIHDEINRLSNRSPAEADSSGTPGGH